MLVTLEKGGGVATVTLNRPDKLNALNEEMREAIAAHFSALGQDDDVRVIILTGAGRGFCGSGDVSSLGNFTPTTARLRLKQAHRMVIAVANVEKPVIAAVRGPVAGIGWSLALACDMIVASETAAFSQVFRNVGLAADGGAVYFLTQMVGLLKAKELVYRGRALGAQDALTMGLVNTVVPDAQLEEEARKLADELSLGPTFALGIAKKMFRTMTTPGLETFLDTEAWGQGMALLTDDHKEGAKAFFEKRKPNFRGR